MDKKREIIQYVIWGVFSSLLNVGLFQILVVSGVDYKISEIITLIVVKIFVYITNKLFVFKTKYQGIGNLLKELVAFIFARSATFVLDFVGVFVLVEVFKINTFISKCLVAFIVVSVNYILSTKFIFRRKVEKK